MPADEHDGIHVHTRYDAVYISVPCVLYRLFLPHAISVLAPVSLVGFFVFFVGPLWLNETSLVELTASAIHSHREDARAHTFRPHALTSTTAPLLTRRPTARSQTPLRGRTRAIEWSWPRHNTLTTPQQIAAKVGACKKKHGVLWTHKTTLQALPRHMYKPSWCQQQSMHARRQW